jgi:rhamnosyltransferase
MKIKILLATYNGAKYIEEQLQSIIGQEDVTIDILVSDDGSTDNTVNLIKTNFPSIELGVNKLNTRSAAKNFLKMLLNLDLQQNFDFVAFSDQDDIWLPKKMQAAVTLLNNEGGSLYCSNLTKWDTSNNSFIELKKNFPQKKFDFLFEGGSAGCTYVFTKQLAISLQESLPNLNTTDWKEFSHDWLVYFFARANKFKVVIDGNSYIHYRLHDANVHGHLNKLSFATLRDKSKHVLDGYYQNNASRYISLLDRDSEAFKIYRNFLSGYFKRNWTIWKYNTQLMRDKKKFVIFTLLNIFKFK